VLEIEKFLDLCPYIDSETKYWFIRTESGIYYDSFKQKQIVGLDWGKIKYKDLNVDLTDDDKFSELLEKIRLRYPEKKRPGLIANQLFRLKQEMKVGDYVLCPSWGTHLISIGRIVSEELEEVEISYLRKDGQSGKKTLRCRYVEWIKTVERNKINPRLERSFSSQLAIVDVTEQSEWVDTLLYDFYKKGSEYHYVVNVKTQQKINAKELYKTLNDLVSMLEIAGNALNIDTSVNIATTTINLNSPGYIKIIGATVGIGLLGAILVGGQVDASWTKLNGFDLTGLNQSSF
jgi:restriction system protein